MAVVGQNGSGKSTLAKHMNALLLPDRGTVTVNGIPTGDETAGEIRQTVGMIFQNPTTRSSALSLRRMWPSDWKIWACLGIRSAPAWTPRWPQSVCRPTRSKPPHAVGRTEAASGRRRRYRHAPRVIVLTSQRPCWIPPDGPRCSIPRRDSTGAKASPSFGSPFRRGKPGGRPGGGHVPGPRRHGGVPPRRAAADGSPPGAGTCGPAVIELAARLRRPDWASRRSGYH